MSIGDYIKDGRVYCRHDTIPGKCSLCDLETDLKNLKWLAQQMCIDLMKGDSSKAEGYNRELCKFDHIEGERAPVEKPLKKQVRKYWILLMYGSGKTVDEIVQLTQSPRRYIQAILGRTEKYRLDMAYKKNEAKK